MKYSFIVSVFNGEENLDACLESLFKQTYTNFEVIVINDGSTDETSKVLSVWKEKYPSKLMLIERENKGLSVSRNEGMEKATGDYILFVDHDDYMKENALEVIEKNNQGNPDLIKFGYEMVYANKPSVPINTTYEEGLYRGEEAFSLLVASPTLFEMATLYAYRLSFLKKEKLSFTEGRYHEDFGLVPYSIVLAKKVRILSTILYSYVQSENSITRNEDYLKTVKKADDILFFALILREKIDKITVEDKTKQLFKSFLANAVLGAYEKLQTTEATLYKKKIKEYKIIDDLMEDTWIRRVKKVIKKIQI